ncbi:MAG TPA: DUF3048 domain-containing protein [Candidatus Polarisedimenticolaceae bacterium]|nr:DUF3048 domain-containing protein [Candidatus Polarisedimenticolaceae bacterium]
MPIRDLGPKGQPIQIKTSNDSGMGEAPPPGPPIPPIALPPPGRWNRFKRFLRTHRTRIIIILGLLIIAPTATWAYIQYTKPITPVSSDVKVKKKPKPPVPTTKPSPLTGVEVEPALADRAIRAIVVENSPEARPQSGLSQAGVVYEALAEGGITRFLTFFLEGQPPSIGPVRSLRPYFNDWTLEFNSPISHAGGSAEALGQVGPLKVKSINALAGGNNQYFTRSGDRAAPHNLYTNSAAQDQLLQAKGYAQPATFTPNPRKKDEPPATPAHTIISINYSYSGFQVEYHYNKPCNCYDRFMAGAPHIDRNTGAQIQVKNVVIQYMSVGYDSTGHAIIGLLGTGKTVVLRDGGSVEGTWSKATYEQRTKLLDPAGKEIPLNKGNTWFSIVPDSRPISY